MKILSKYMLALMALAASTLATQARNLDFHVESQVNNGPGTVVMDFSIDTETPPTWTAPDGNLVIYYTTGSATVTDVSDVIDGSYEIDMFEIRLYRLGSGDDIYNVASLCFEANGIKLLLWLNCDGQWMTELTTEAFCDGIDAITCTNMVLELEQHGGGQLLQEDMTGDVTCAPMCGCEDGVAALSLKSRSCRVYYARAFQSDGTEVFSGPVSYGQTIEFAGMNPDGGFGDKVHIKYYYRITYCGRVYYRCCWVRLDTSCATPVGPGTCVGPFNVVEALDVHGDPLCPVQ